MARHWEGLGAQRLHVVDLDGAREGGPRNLDVVGAICRAVEIPVELGGGMRTEEMARQALDVGVDRVILGTAALDRRVAEQMIRALGESVVAGIDARDGLVAVEGWTDTTEVRALDLARELVSLGVQWVIFTDIARDGMLEGPNVAALREMVAGVEASIIASGGIKSIDDLIAVRDAGAAGAIIGTALYTGQLDLEKALEAVC
jgi:phosphoribosylformimino-5-aminoimidazole carboxamide ribotide isomerase